MDNCSDANDLIEVVRTIKEIEDSRIKYACENEELKEIIRDLQNELDEKDRCNREDVALKGDQELKILSMSLENESLKSAIQNKETELKELRCYYRELEKEKKKYANLRKDLHNCETQICKVTETIIKLEHLTKANECKINEESDLMKKVKEKFSKYRQILQKLSEENNRLMKGNKQCNQRLAETEKENEILIQKLRLYENADHKVNRCLKKHRLCAQQLKNNLNKEISYGENLKNKISALQSKNGKSKREIAKLKEDIAYLNEELDMKQIEFDRCLAELKLKIHEFESFKDAIMISLKVNIANMRQITPKCGHNRHFRSQSQPPSVSLKLCISEMGNKKAKHVKSKSVNCCSRRKTRDYW